jgi:pSer/pThr/pTyr-binding forkhead associated (FHA) protein
MSTYRIQVRVTQEEHPRTQVLEFDHAPLAIGALPRNDVVLDDDRVSGDHAVVTVSRRALVIEDRSRNGTFVGGKRIERHRLRPGEDVSIGPYRLTLSLELLPVDRATAAEKPPAGPHANASLVVVDGPAEVLRRTFVLTGERMRIGRAPDADAAIPEPTLSRLHAELVRVAAGRFVVRDLKSANGTFVNGEKTRFSPLRPGDRVMLGDRVTLAFALEPAPDEGGAKG